ncbi:MAG: sigma-70 family RNA polymerase sigma factor [Actinomycetota bacterium]
MATRRSVFRAVDYSTFDDFCRQEHSTLVDALIWSFGDRDLGREAADEAMARAFERWDQVSGYRNPAGWTYRVGLNWGRRRLRRANRGAELVRHLPPQPGHYHLQPQPDLEAALDDLPVKQRAVIVLRHLLGHTDAQTAEILGISVGTVKSRNSRALEKLRHTLQENAQ